MTAQGWRKRKKVDGGKGDAPRDSANQEAYNVGWDRIFGNKDKEDNKKVEEALDRMAENARELGLEY